MHASCSDIRPAAPDSFARSEATSRARAPAPGIADGVPGIADGVPGIAVPGNDVGKKLVQIGGYLGGGDCTAAATRRHAGATGQPSPPGMITGESAPAGTIPGHLPPPGMMGASVTPPRVRVGGLRWLSGVRESLGRPGGVRRLRLTEPSERFAQPLKCALKPILAGGDLEIIPGTAGFTGF
eukprot:scaffold16747_cov86-Isochrysis_galbana.AAC.3